MKKLNLFRLRRLTDPEKKKVCAFMCMGIVSLTVLTLIICVLLTLDVVFNTNETITPVLMQVDSIDYYEAYVHGGKDYGSVCVVTVKETPINVFLGSASAPHNRLTFRVPKEMRQVLKVGDNIYVDKIITETGVFKLKKERWVFPPSIGSRLALRAR